jgi:hypothetical protein
MDCSGLLPSYAYIDSLNIRNTNYMKTRKRLFQNTVIADESPIQEESNGCID